MTFRIHVLLLFVSLACNGLAWAQPAERYPTKPVRLVVPFPPGGGVDVLGRIAAQKLSEGLGRPVIVDNRGGASGNIGAELVARAPADGYTLLFSSATLAISPALYPKMVFDVVRDLAPITQFASAPHLLCIHPSLPVKSVQELIAFAKARPHQINYASQSSGSTSHLAAEMLNSAAGVKLVHVPYKGNAPALTALVSGEVSLSFPVLVTAQPQIKAGRIKALATTSKKRSPLFPDLPTMDESGVRGFEATQWWGLWTANGVPQPIVAQLSREMASILKLQDVRDKLAVEGADPVGGTPAEFARFINDEMSKWAKLVKLSGAKPE